MNSLQSYFQHIEYLCIVGPLFEGELALLDEFEHIVFVDGGAKFKKEKGISVGDNDSTKIKLDIVLDRDKDYSDLAFVLQKIPKTVQNIRLFGFEKGRLDHQLFNLGELFYFLQKSNVKIESESFYGLPQGENKLELNGLFSVICFRQTSLQLIGDCRYPIEKTRSFRALDSNLLSNEGFGEVVFNHNQPLFVLFDQLK